jgi:uncharacterized protein YjbI with pentapeptide repeats
MKGRGVKFVGAILTKADLSKANLAGADLTNADLRNATLTDSKLEGANLTGAKVFGLVAKGLQINGIKADWLDNSPNADGSVRVVAAQIAAVLTGAAPARPADERSANRRYFGRGDVLRNASLQFDEGATVEIESLFEACTIALGRGTELVIGADGVLTGCQITGAGNITINGKFFEKGDSKKNGAGVSIAGAHQLVVTSTGALVGAVQQPAELTRFAFEPGCQLRMKISTAGNGSGNGNQTKSARR